MMMDGWPARGRTWLIGRIVVAALIVFTAVAYSVAGQPPQHSADLLVASDGSHLWYVETGDAAQPRRGVLMHHGPGMEPGVAAPVVTLETLPEALLAIDGRLYLVFPLRDGSPGVGGWASSPSWGSRAGSPTSRRHVSSIRVAEFDRSSQLWTYGSDQRATTEVALPGEGVIGGLAADGRRPLVLLVNEAEKSDERPQIELLRLSGREWEAADLPERVAAAEAWGLGGGDRPLLIAAGGRWASSPTWGSRAGSPTSEVFTLLDDGSWTAAQYDLDPRRLRGWAVGGGQTIVGMSAEDGEAIDLVLLRGGHSYHVVRVAAPADETHLLTWRGRPALVQRHPTGLEITMYDPGRGEEVGSVVVGRRLAPRLHDFRLLTLVGALLIATLVMYLFRPAQGSRPKVTLPENTSLAEPQRRLVALLIDLFPAGLLCGLILGVPFGQVFNLGGMPLLATRWEQAWPVMLMFILTVVHGGIGELLWGASLGKGLMDCRVVAPDGGRSSAVGIVARNVMKLVELVVPVIFLFVYLNPHRQRLGDMAGRTIVVTLREPEEGG